MLDKGTLISSIEAAFRSAEPGVDSVSSLASAIGNAIEAYVKSGKVKVDTIGGTCTASGSHPPLHSEGTIT